MSVASPIFGKMRVGAVAESEKRRVGRVAVLPLLRLCVSRQSFRMTGFFGTLKTEISQRTKYSWYKSTVQPKGFAFEG